jgi:hypothetical protein
MTELDFDNNILTFSLLNDEIFDINYGKIGWRPSILFHALALLFNFYVATKKKLIKNLKISMRTTRDLEVPYNCV